MVFGSVSFIRIEDAIGEIDESEYNVAKLHGSILRFSYLGNFRLIILRNLVAQNFFLYSKNFFVIVFRFDGQTLTHNRAVGQFSNEIQSK